MTAFETFKNITLIHLEGIRKYKHEMKYILTWTKKQRLKLYVQINEIEPTRETKKIVVSKNTGRPKQKQSNWLLQS